MRAPLARDGLPTAPGPPDRSPDAPPEPDLRPLLAPRSIAVVGASEGRGAGPIVLANLRHLGFAGEVYPVNPKYRELAGWPCYPSLGDVPGPVDSIAILLSSERILPVLEEAVGLEIPAAWVLASGFSEAGHAGAALQRELTTFARRHGLALCGPNCVGIVNFHERAGMYSVALPGSVTAGHVGAVIQSGAVCLGLINANRGVAFSTVISSGNEAVLDNSDYIAYLADDPQTRVIVAFIEGFKRPERFILAVERARAAGKPVLVVKVGRSAVGRRATAAHTGSLAGADVIHDAVFRKHGVIRLDNLDELLEAAELFLRAPVPAGSGVAMLTLSGGQIGLIGDTAVGLRLDFPEFDTDVRAALKAILPSYSPVANPLDAWGAGNYEETYPACLEAVGADRSTHLIAVARDSSPGIAAREIRQSEVIVDAAARVRDASGKPVVVFANLSTGLEPSVQARAGAVGLPLLQGTRESLRAIEALLEYGARQRRPVPPSPVSPLDPAELDRVRRRLVADPGPLGEAEAKELLLAAGIPVTPERLAGSAAAAVRCAQELGFPVAVKIHSSVIQHKTEAGGVVLALRSAPGVRRAYRDVVARAREHAGDIAGRTVLVQKMAPPGALEVIVGSIVDPEFGPTVVFGLGGVQVELTHDSVVRLAPISLEEAHEMITSIRGSALLRGFRGSAPLDVVALADVIVRISHIAHELRNELAAVEVNPLMVLPVGQGVLAVDALAIRS
jgi:acetate---CoA ligase (ADP-forming)